MIDPAFRACSINGLWISRSLPQIFTRRRLTHMTTSRHFTTLLTALFAMLVMSAAAFAADPGLPVPATSEASDQKAGALLFYNAYTSSATSANTANTRINITNTNALSGIFVHLFFVDGSNCSVADSFVCLTQNQTASFLTSDVDPGISGYIVAVLVNGNGIPIPNGNVLIGDEYVKYATGHSANLGAVAFSHLSFRTASLNPDQTL